METEQGYKTNGFLTETPETAAFISRCGTIHFINDVVSIATRNTKLALHYERSSHVHCVLEYAKYSSAHTLQNRRAENSPKDLFLSVGLFHHKQRSQVHVFFLSSLLQKQT